MEIIGLDLSLTCTGMAYGNTAETIKTVQDKTLSNEVDTIRRAAKIIGALDVFMNRCFGIADAAIYIEAPMLAPTAGHLYELGIVTAEVVRWATVTRWYEVKFVNHHAMVSQLFGIGGVNKHNIAAHTHRKYGVIFDKDAGADKLHAFLYYQYGLGVSKGLWELGAIKRRGSKKKKAVTE